MSVSVTLNIVRVTLNIVSATLNLVSCLRTLTFVNSTLTFVSDILTVSVCADICQRHADFCQRYADICQRYTGSQRLRGYRSASTLTLSEIALTAVSAIAEITESFSDRIITLSDSQVRCDMSKNYTQPY
ncbi:hypothetical protein MUCCIDRAFT_106232 [Mucor lusitanicus CBS 277.49]|uniref:Uncharacterized protein n=1 Tax=Mucor lusitanicus CBS 277.49 TaxID=747725 RepID=A0A168N1V7_MUCCL|nr:hypothetical protein MUCCIDRAFT_106232 [Mucor lusitanicus CBS 277.49]